MGEKETDSSYEVVIENCRNIDRAVILIERGKLNVKFAPNGTGKSSIAKALVAMGADIDNPGLVPFKFRQVHPSDKHLLCVSGLGGVSSVELFDESYVQSVVFQQNSLFPDGFDVFVRSPEFIATERELRDRLGDLVALAVREDVRKLASDLDTLRTDLIGKSGLDRSNRPKAASPVVKALRDGNMWNHGGSMFAPFKPILGSGPFKKWALWHKQGADCLAMMDKACPYCGQATFAVSERIDAADEAFNSAKVGNIEKVMEAVSVGGAYMSDATIKQLNAIVDSAEPITDQAKGFIGKVAQDAELFSATLQKLQTVSSYFDLSAADDLVARLGACKINVEYLDSLNSVKCREIAERVNKAVEVAMTNTDKLKALVNRQKARLAKSIEGKCGEINAFLVSAGYPYTVAISDVADGKCSVRLIHSSSWEVDDSREALSYGERNAFALVFFSYECMRKNPDMVILVDPISSFDGAKRYALLNMLFLGGVGDATLKGKTVFLLTHDYGTLFDIEHTHKSAFQPLAKSCILSYARGIVTETPVKPEDMVLADVLYARLAKNSNNPMVGLVYARKLLEIRGDKSAAYDIVSSLFHHRPFPVHRDGSPLEPDEIDSGIAQLEAIVDQSVDYKKLFETVVSPLNMLDLFDAPVSNYEKLQLARIATQVRMDDKVLKERMDDSVHVGNGYLYQLDPSKFELVPSQLVERCREVLLAME